MRVNAPTPNSKHGTANADRLADGGWALGGDLAALELGAPLFTVDDRR